MLVGAETNVWTDHKNLTFRTMSMQQILRWRLFLEGFNVTIRQVPGIRNNLADCFSRLPQMTQPSVGNREIEMILKQKGKLVN